MAYATRACGRACARSFICGHGAMVARDPAAGVCIAKTAQSLQQHDTLHQETKILYPGY